VNLFGGDRLALRRQGRELRCGQLAQPGEIFNPRKSADANKAEAGRAAVDRGEPVQVPYQDQLVEQIVLEPEHDLVVRVKPFERGVPRAQAGQHLGLGLIEPGRQVPRPHLAEGVRGKAGGSRAVVQDIRPDGRYAADRRAFELKPGRIAVEHVQHAPFYSHTPHGGTDG
jgi:hypothetical protein